MIDLTFDHVFRQQILWVKSCWPSDLRETTMATWDWTYCFECGVLHTMGWVTPWTRPPSLQIKSSPPKSDRNSTAQFPAIIRESDQDSFIAETSDSIGVFSQIPIDPRVCGWLSPTKRGHFVQVRPHHSPISVLLTQTDVCKAPLLAVVHSSSRFFFNDCWLWSVV